MYCSSSRTTTTIETVGVPAGTVIPCTAPVVADLMPVVRPSPAGSGSAGRGTARPAAAWAVPERATGLAAAAAAAGRPSRARRQREGCPSPARGSARRPPSPRRSAAAAWARGEQPGDAGLLRGCHDRPARETVRHRGVHDRPTGRVFEHGDARSPIREDLLVRQRRHHLRMGVRVRADDVAGRGELVHPRAVEEPGRAEPRCGDEELAAQPVLGEHRCHHVEGAAPAVVEGEDRPGRAGPSGHRLEQRLPDLVAVGSRTGEPALAERPPVRQDVVQHHDRCRSRVPRAAVGRTPSDACPPLEPAVLLAAAPSRGPVDRVSSASS